MADKPKRTRTKKSEPAGVEIVSIKGFDSRMQCRGFQFEPGKTYEHKGAVQQCASGFHACPVEHHPFSVFEYYPPAGSRFFEVRQSGETSNGGTKLASAKITIGIELHIGDLVKRAWDYVWSRAVKTDGASTDLYRGAAFVTGTQGAASATGDLGAAFATGDRGAAFATGTRGAASATGTRGAASATGDLGAAFATGTRGAASATGYQGAASATGDLGAASATGDLGAAFATGDRGAASATGYQGAASATGDLGAAFATGYRGAASATGDLGAAFATGDRGAASATGYQGAASATGDLGAASATGYRGAASATGDLGAAFATGTRGAASATGTRGAAVSSYEGRVMGAIGNALFAIERDANLDIISVACGIVGQDGIEPNTWYVAKSGKLVAA